MKYQRGVVSRPKSFYFSFMRKAVTILFVSFLFFFLSGCLTTLFPIFKLNDVTFNPELIGLWKYKDDKSEKFIEFEKIPAEREKELTEEINKIADKGYLASRMDSTGKLISQCFVFLASIGKNYYLDFYPAELPSQKDVNSFYKDHFIKAHQSYRIDFRDKDHFDMKRFDSDFLNKLISNNKINIRHKVVDGKNVITAPTEELQKFIIQYTDNPKAFVTETFCERTAYY